MLWVGLSVVEFSEPVGIFYMYNPIQKPLSRENKEKVPKGKLLQDILKSNTQEEHPVEIGRAHV